MKYALKLPYNSIWYDIIIYNFIFDVAFSNTIFVQVWRQQWGVSSITDFQWQG